MRMGVSLTVSALACAVAVGCGSGPQEAGGGSSRAVPTSRQVGPAPTPTRAETTDPTAAPTAGAAMSDVIRWIEGGTAADPGSYRSVTRDGAATSLGDGVAFVTAGDATNCVTNRYADGALACLVKLTNPPPRPPDFPTGWKNNWVDFDGTSVQVGSPHGDPGPFAAGSGAVLANGHTLAFGDYRCRADAAGLFCVNYAHQSAVRMSAAGMQPFGCLREAPPPPDIGILLSC